MGVTNYDAVKAYLYGNNVRSAGGTLFSDGDILYSYGKHWILAIRHGRTVFINNDYYSKTTAKHRSYVVSQTPRHSMVDVSMGALSEAVLEVFRRENHGGSWDIEEFMQDVEIIETHDGEALLRRFGDYYLIGRDDTIRDGINKTFVTQLRIDRDGPPEGICEAYDRMIPEIVKYKQGVKRQGDWFFFPIAIKDPLIKQCHCPLKNKEGEEGSHIASEWFQQGKDQYVKGIIKHPEHKQLKLYYPPKPKQLFWHVAVEAERENSWSGATKGGID